MRLLNVQLTLLYPPLIDDISDFAAAHGTSTCPDIAKAVLDKWGVELSNDQVMNFFYLGRHSYPLPDHE